MPKHCPFCAQPANTQEHVWGDAIVKRAIGKPKDGVVWYVMKGRANSRRGDMEAAPQIVRRVESDTVKATVGVCKACNTGWMSDLETACGDYVVKMAHGETTLIPWGAQFDLARFALKTAVTHEASLSVPDAAKIVPQSEIDILRARDISPRVAVNLFTYNGARATYGRLLAPPFNIGTPRGPSRRAFVCTMGLDKLVFQVLGYAGPEDRALRYDQVSAGFRVPIWPRESVGAIKWPPRYPLRDDELEALAIQAGWAQLT